MSFAEEYMNRHNNFKIGLEMDINDAFDFLVDSLKKEQEKVKQEITLFLNRNNFNSVRESTMNAEKIQALFDELIDLQKKWDALLQSDNAEKCEVLLLKEEIRKWNSPLPKREPLVLRLSNNERTFRAPNGKKTNQNEFRLPILRTLAEMGGNARVGRVLERVRELMAGILNDFDREVLPKGKDIRWRNTAMWERNTMREEGLIADNSPKGIWEITDKGRRYLQEHQ